MQRKTHTYMHPRYRTSSRFIMSATMFPTSVNLPTSPPNPVLPYYTFSFLSCIQRMYCVIYVCVSKMSSGSAMLILDDGLQQCL